MTSRYLNELSIKGKEATLNRLPEFDFYKLFEITTFKWSAFADEITGRVCPELILTALYGENADAVKAIVVLRCSDVTRVVFPPLGHSFAPAELEVEDLSGDQLEGIRYRLYDFYDKSFEVLCNDLEVLVND
jgi:hypothetical protein